MKNTHPIIAFKQETFEEGANDVPHTLWRQIDLPTDIKTPEQARKYVRDEALPGVYSFSRELFYVEIDEQPTVKRDVTYA